MMKITSNIMMLVGTIVVMTVTNVSALYVYDCAADGLNVTTISLLDVDDCPIYETQDIIDSIEVQVLQQRETYDLHVFRCDVQIKYTITHCGMHSHASRVHNGEATKLWDLSPAECQSIHRTRSTVVLGKMLLNLKLNSSETRLMTLAGSADKTGSCTGGYVSIGSDSWSSVYATAEIKITLSDFVATHKVNGDRMVTPSGISCVFSEGYCLDVELGLLVWDQQTRRDCDRTSYHVLYTGKASKVTVIEQSSHRSSYVLYSIKSGSFLATLMQQDPIRICGMDMFTTDHNKLIVQEVTNGVHYFSKDTLPVKDMDLFLYVNAKFTHLEKHSRKEMTRMYTAFMKELCAIKRHTLRTMLTIAAIDPVEFAFSYMRKPGYTALVMGETINIVQCKPVFATVAKTDNCYMELPVNYSGVVYYMSPKSHILQKTGTPLTCSMFMQPTYQLEGKWFSSTTYVTMTKEPKQLAVNMEPVWEYTDAGDLAKAGIYSDDDLSRLRSQIMYPSERKAISQTISAAINEDSVIVDASIFKNLITKEALEQSVNNFFGTTWSHFISIGTFFSGIFGIMLICKLIKIMFDTIVNARGLYEIYGFGWRMFMGIWDAATTYLMSPHRVWKYNQQNPKASPPKYDDVEIVSASPNHHHADIENTQQTLYPSLNHESAPLTLTTDHNDTVVAIPNAPMSSGSKKPYKKYSSK